jgi:hypothetical protein
MWTRMRNAEAQGRWWLDFATQPSLDPSGYEFILSDGIATTAETGESAGRYEIADRHLKLDFPVPVIPGEAPWRIEAKFMLSYLRGATVRLTGIIRVFDSGGAVLLQDICTLVRRSPDS